MNPCPSRPPTCYDSLHSVLKVKGIDGLVALSGGVESSLVADVGDVRTWGGGGGGGGGGGVETWEGLEKSRGSVRRSVYCWRRLVWSCVGCVIDIVRAG